MVSMETKSGLEVHLGYWLRRVSNHVSGAFARALQARSVSVAEWVVLSRLSENQQATPGELATELTLTRGAVSKIVDKLEVKAWITRRASTEDQRVQFLSLTRQGRKTLPQLAEIADRNDSRFFDCLTAGEQAELSRVLRKLASTHKIDNIPVE